MFYGISLIGIGWLIRRRETKAMGTYLMWATDDLGGIYCIYERDLLSQGSSLREG